MIIGVIYDICSKKSSVFEHHKWISYWKGAMNDEKWATKSTIILVKVEKLVFN